MASGPYDPTAERSRLAGELKESLTAGFFSAETSSAGAFSFIASYLPLANVLSEQSGVLVHLLPQRTLATARREILDARYPLIFVDPSVVLEAARAGYRPLVVSREKVSASFLASAASSIRRIDATTKARVAWSSNAAITYVAMAAFGSLGSAHARTYIDVGALGERGAVAQVLAGAADVAVIRASQAKSALAQHKGKLVPLGQAGAVPALSVWIRQDLQTLPLAQRIRDTLLQLSKTATGKSGLAAFACERSIGVECSFQLPPTNFAEDMSRGMHAAARAFPAHFAVAPAAEATAPLPPVSPISGPLTGEASADHGRLAPNTRGEVSIGFSTGGLPIASAHDFNLAMLPLTKHLSQRAGALVTLSPHPSPEEFSRALADRKFSSVVIGPSMAQAAKASGYRPVAQAGDLVGARFLVHSSSPIKSLSDLSGKRVAAVQFSEASTIGRYALQRIGVTDAQYVFLGRGADRQDAANRSLLTQFVVAGAADAALVDSRSPELQAAGIPGSSMRILSGIDAFAALSLWVREDLVHDPAMRSITETWVGLAPQADSKFDSFSRLFAVSRPWHPSSMLDQTRALEMSLAMIGAPGQGASPTPTTAQTREPASANKSLHIRTRERSHETVSP